MQHPREAAENGIAAALAPLAADEAMLALVELQAAILAELGIIRGTSAFDRIGIGYLALLAERVAAMNRALRVTTH